MVLKSVEEAKQALKGYFGDGDQLNRAVYYSTEELENTITEIADDEIDVYNDVLLEWAKVPKNQYDIDEYKTQLGEIDLEADGSKIVFDLIRGGQYYHNFTLLNEAVSELHNELPEDYIGD